MAGTDACSYNTLHHATTPEGTHRNTLHLNRMRLTQHTPVSQADKPHIPLLNKHSFHQWHFQPSHGTFHLSELRHDKGYIYALSALFGLYLYRNSFISLPS
jgi:hypothetical protein